jgi:hypothetical protein
LLAKGPAGDLIPTPHTWGHEHDANRREEPGGNPGSAFARRSRRHRRALLSAIASAAAGGLFVASSKTDGLRAIRLFEQINGVAFDPFNSYHRALVANTGWHFALQRRLAR